MKAIFFLLSLSLSVVAMGQTGNTSAGNNAGSTSKGDYNSYFGQYAGRYNATGRLNTYIGRSAGENNNSGIGNVFVGYKAGQNNKGSKNIFIGFKAGMNETGSQKLYIANSETNTPLIYGDFSTAELTVNGSFFAPEDVFKPGGGSWSALSDKRLKKDIRPFTDGLEVLEKINPVRFRYNGKANTSADKEHIGVIAQEVQEAAPYTVSTFTHKAKDGSETEYLEYDGTALKYIMVNAVKEQQALLQAQQPRLETLENRMAATDANGKENLQERIKALEDLMAGMTETKKGSEHTLHAAADKK